MKFRLGPRAQYWYYDEALFYFLMDMAAESPIIRTRNKTYVRRESRITRAQRRALAEFSERYVLSEITSTLELASLFPSADRYAVELGFGDGDALVEMASANPDTGYIGVEVYRPGVGRCLQSLNDRGLDNVRVYTQDARDLMTNHIPGNSLGEIYILFPDPWPKKRHHKRRLVNSEFIALCASRMQVGSRLHFATDCRDYAYQTLYHLEASEEFENTCGAGFFCTDEGVRPKTRYERKAEQRGDRIYDLIFERADR